MKTVYILYGVQFCRVVTEGRRLCYAAVQGKESALCSQVSRTHNVHMYMYLSLLLAPSCIYTIVYSINLFSYNVEDDQVSCFLRIPMEKVEKIVIGIYISNHSLIV